MILYPCLAAVNPPAQKLQERAGCSKWSMCKAHFDPATEGYELYAAGSREKRNAADGPFSATC